jgi:hypothetical protein
MKKEEAIIKYVDYLFEHMNKVINYTEYVAEELDIVIQFLTEKFGEEFKNYRGKMKDETSENKSLCSDNIKQYKDMFNNE